MITLILLILILGIPVAIIIAIHFISNAIGKKMRVVLHKENEPAVYIGDDDNLFDSSNTNKCTTTNPDGDWSSPFSDYSKNGSMW